MTWYAAVFQVTLCALLGYCVVTMNHLKRKQRATVKACQQIVHNSESEADTARHEAASWRSRYFKLEAEHDLCEPVSPEDMEYIIKSLGGS